MIASYGGKGSYVSAASSSSYGDGNWHHAAMTLASSGVFTLYIDGAAVATDSYSEASGTRYYTHSLYLGVLTSTSFSNSSYFKGQMRDVRFWSDTRSAAEVLANKDATLTGAESGLFAWYTLDQGAGGGASTSTRTIIDSAGSNDAEPLNFTMGGTVSNFVAFVDNTDLDASLTAAAGVAEPVAIPTTVDTVGESLDVFDFTLTDGGTAAALALGVSQVVVNVSGTATDAQRSQVTWRLNGPDASNVTGTYSAGADTLTFSSLSISVADGTSEIYTVNAYFNDNTSLTDNATVILSVDGDTDLITTGTGMGATTAVSNGSGTLITVAATKLAYATEPAGSASGVAFTSQPVVRALDAADNVNIGADVILLKGVIIGDNVGFASFLNMPSGVALTNTLSFIAVPGREGQTALDLRGESIAGAATAPRTSYLDLVAEVPEFEEPGAAIKQQPQGEIEMEFSDSEARMVPIRITKTDTPDADEVGFSYDDDGNLSIRLPSLLEIIMYPMFTDDDALLAAIKKEDPAYGLKYGADSYFEITKDTETGLAATLPRYVGRPGLSAVKLASGTERELGFFTYPSPFLANVNAVSLITRNDVGALMEQEMVPAPSDWLLFKTRVLKEGRVSRVSIDPRGVITIHETAGYEFRVLADYAVIPNAVFSKEGRPIVFINAGDLNANGEDDYYSYYPNGDRQTLYVFPQ